MKAFRRATAAVLSLVAASVLLPVRAEVSAQVDAFGTYVRTVVIANASTRNVRIWTVSKTRPGYFPLNPLGDQNGDLWPTIAENPVDSRLPWVVWSRFNGQDFDLAWSQFRNGAWSPVAPVEATSAQGDDLAPSVTFDLNGRSYVAWWRNENGIGRVYFSMFLVTRWMPAFPVSDDGVDSLNPVITILSDTTIRVDYDTPAGHVTRILVFNRPSTITDDITPFGSVNFASTATTPTIH